MSDTPRDNNRIPGLIAKSDADNTPIAVEADPITKRLKVNATITGGDVQYADGDVRGIATGTLAMVDDGTNIRSAHGDSAGNLLIAGNIASSATDSGNPIKVGGIYTATQPTFTDGQRGNFQINTRGGLKTSLFVNDSTTAISARSDNADAVGASSTVNNLAIINRNTVYNGTTWDRMSGDTTGINVKNIVGSIVPGTGATNLGKAEDAVHTTGDTGIAVLAVRDDTLNATSGTEGDYEMLHTTATGGLWVTQAPSTSGGWSTAMMTTADGSTALTATAQAIKASAGTFGGYYIYNPNSAATYVHIYNVAFGSVTVGTTNPQCTFCIPATSGANLEIGNGVNFTTAMSTAATTTGGGNTAPATALEAVFYYA